MYSLFTEFWCVADKCNSNNYYKADLIGCILVEKNGDHLKPLSMKEAANKLLHELPRKEIILTTVLTFSKDC